MVVTWQVSARIGADMDNSNTWSHMASVGAFLAALHVRPIMDVLWTQPVQRHNPNQVTYRRYIEHELVIAVLTTGAVGFGDSLPQDSGFAGTILNLVTTLPSHGTPLALRRMMTWQVRM